MSEHMNKFINILGFVRIEDFANAYDAANLTDADTADDLEAGIVEKSTGVILNVDSIVAIFPFTIYPRFAHIEMATGTRIIACRSVDEMNALLGVHPT